MSVGSRETLFNSFNFFVNSILPIRKMRSSIIVVISGLLALASVVIGLPAKNQGLAVDCSLVSVFCLPPPCSKPIPANPRKGKCCETCPLNIDCTFVLCAAPPCVNPTPPNPAEGKCCPTCPDIVGICRYDGNTYQVGDSFPATDGCNTCTCTGPGQVACTEKACVPPPGLVCPQRLPGSNGICVNLCSSDEDCPEGKKCCSNGCGRVCQTAVSSDSGLWFNSKVMIQQDSCKYNGNVYQVGDSFPAIDGCNTCFCTGSGNVGCTKKACVSSLPLVCPPIRPGSNGICVNLCSSDEECPEGKKCCSNGCGRVCQTAVSGDNSKVVIQKRTCKYNGNVYQVGDSFPASDGCNTCGCIAPDDVVCTLIACSQSAAPKDTSICPPDKPLGYCFVDPCQFASCPAHPDAECVADYCGGCNAWFYENKINVTESCQCPVIGQVFTRCGSACPPNCTNPTPICTRQCVPRCQCPPGQVINEATNECVPVNECPPKMKIQSFSDSICPPDKPLVNCFANPCQFASCPAYPNAECIADFCGGCNARFYLGVKPRIEVTDYCIPLYD